MMKRREGEYANPIAQKREQKRKNERGPRNPQKYGGDGKGPKGSKYEILGPNLRFLEQNVM